MVDEDIAIVDWWDMYACSFLKTVFMYVGHQVMAGFGHCDDGRGDKTISVFLRSSKPVPSKSLQIPPMITDIALTTSVSSGLGHSDTLGLYCDASQTLYVSVWLDRQSKQYEEWIACPITVRKVSDCGLKIQNPKGHRVSTKRTSVRFAVSGNSPASNR